MTRNIGITLSYERIPARADTIRLPAGDTCNANQQLTETVARKVAYLGPQTPAR